MGTRRTRARTIVAILATALAAACGNDDPQNAAETTPEPSASGASATPNYANEVRRIYDRYVLARRELLRGSNERSALRGQAETTQAALARAAREMQEIDPPAAAEPVHERMTQMYREYADELADELDRDRLRASKIHRIASESHEDIDRALGDVYVAGG